MDNLQAIGYVLHPSHLEFMEGLTEIAGGLTGDSSGPTTSGNDPMLSSSAGDLSTSSALARSPVAPVSMSGIVDSSEFRSQVPEPTYHTLNGRMTPGGVGPVPGITGHAHIPMTQYATLTPLQPLPPISTVTPSEKYSVHVSGPAVLACPPNPPTPSGFFNVQPSDVPNSLSNFAVPAVNTYNVNIKYEYDIKPPPGMANGPQNGVTQTGMNGNPNLSMATTTSQYTSMPNVIPVTMHPPQSFGNYCGGYNSNHGTPEHHRSPKQEPKMFPGNGFDSTQGYPSPGALGPGIPSPLPGVGPMVSGGGLMNGLSPPLTAQQQANLELQASATMPHIITNHQSPQHSVALSNRKQSTKSHSQHISNTSTPGPVGMGPGTELEEINTKELAQRISAELKRYSIPQAIFAQRVLCRSQGTLSDLLRNPKPWSKLKSGRETFRRMLKWLEEPEFQRMSALRLAGM